MVSRPVLSLPPMDCVPATWQAWSSRPLSRLAESREWEHPSDHAPVLLACVLLEGPQAVRAASHCAETVRLLPTQESDQDVVSCLDDVPAMIMMRQVRPDVVFRLARATATTYPETLVTGAWLAESAAVYRSRRHALLLPSPAQSAAPSLPWPEDTAVTTTMLEAWCDDHGADETRAARARHERLLARLAMETTPGGVPAREGGTVAALRLRAGRCAMVSASAQDLPLPSKATAGDVLTHLAGSRRLREEVREAARLLLGPRTAEAR